MWHGILIIKKERGLTSHQVVAELRRILRQKEIGHTGTLDPEADGVLVVGVGQATRSFSFLEESVKVYRAEMVLGQETDTQDATGKVLFENPGTNLTFEEIRKCIAELTGTIQQIPPMYSAVKLRGEKLYELARKGMVVDRKPRPVTVFKWLVENPKPVYSFKDRPASVITCSKGTYIRTLIHDLGRKLGCGAHMGRLTRLQSGSFGLENAVTLDEVREHAKSGNLNQIFLSLDQALKHLPSVYPGDEDLRKLKNGGKISFYKYNVAETAPGNLAKAVDDSSKKVIAILKSVDGGSHLYWQPVKVFRY